MCDSLSEGKKIYIKIQMRSGEWCHLFAEDFPRPSIQSVWNEPAYGLAVPVESDEKVVTRGRWLRDCPSRSAD